MESKILELIVVYSLSIILVIINIILIKFAKKFEKEMKDLTEALDRNEEKLLKIKRILEIREEMNEDR